MTLEMSQSLASKNEYYLSLLPFGGEHIYTSTHPFVLHQTGTLEWIFGERSEGDSIPGMNRATGTGTSNCRSFGSIVVKDRRPKEREIEACPVCLFIYLVL